MSINNCGCDGDSILSNSVCEPYQNVTINYGDNDQGQPKVITVNGETGSVEVAPLPVFSNNISDI